ncbi:MAG: hypothetical protein HGA43_13180 [Nitrospirae bacterium]|jgi:hypothetical protein|nr:hypothetical protein [Nitrospirota bacterium]
MKTMVTPGMNPVVDKSTSDGASSSASGEELYIPSRKAFITSINSAVRILKSTVIDGVVVSVKTESQVFT